MIPTSTVPIHPGMSPVLLKAAGIDSKPDPNDDFSKWKKAPKVLRRKMITLNDVPCYNFLLKFELFVSKNMVSNEF